MTVQQAVVADTHITRGQDVLGKPAGKLLVAER